MAFEQNFQEPIVHFESDDEDVPIKQKQYSTQAQATASDNINGCFDCNICLDSAHDPVVTLCGHLYCWPCIYKWLRVQNSSPEPNEQPKCPVCKSKISHSSLVPLYGRGTSPSDSNSRRPRLDLIIPRRPPALSVHPASLPNQPPPQLYHQQYFPQPYGNFASAGSSNFRDAALTSVFSPTVGMFGEMVFARMFGIPETSLFTYPYQNNIYSPLTGSSSPRMRRLEMQVDKSLNRVSIFLFCCFVLCLLLF